MGKKLPKTSKYVLKIIQKAIDEKATFIDLGNCGLKAVPKELVNLPDTITHINLGNDEITVDVKVSPHQKGINDFKKDIKSFKVLKSIKNLTKLEVADCDLQLPNIRIISTLKNLQYLDINWNNIKLEEAREIAKLTNLISLDISVTNIKKEGATAIGELKNLTSLSIRYNNIEKEGAIAISKLTNLTRLDIYSNNIQKEGAIAISKLTNLTRLNIDENNIQKEGAIAISKLTNLTRLNINKNNIQKEGAIAISKLTNLTRLNINKNNIQKEGAIAISKLTNLTSLNINKNNIQKEGAIAISKLTNLTSLDINRNNIQKKGAIAISKLTNLTSLNIGGNNIQKEGAIAIPKLTNLTSLYIYSNNIQKEGAITISKLTNLTSLNIGGNNIQKEGAIAISKLTNLTSLDIDENNIQKEGAIAISKLTNLTRLEISFNNIRNEGAMAISKLTNLTSLFIDSNKIKNRGVRSLFKLTKLNVLFLHNNLITFCVPVLKSTSLLKSNIYIDLSNNPIKDIPSSIINSSNIKSFKNWIKQVEDKKKTKKNTLVKLQVLGNGNAGKSSLIEALAHKKCDHDFTSTHGVVIKPINYTLKKKKINFQVWDFGGQEIYHGTHKLFLRSQAIHLLVGDQESELLAKEKKRVPDRDREEELVLHQPLQHYINLSKQQSSNSTRIVVENKIDLKEKKDDLLEKIAVKNDIAMYPTAATKGTGIKTLRKVLQKKQKNILQYGMIMPKSWINVRQYFLDNLNEELSFKRQLINRKQFNDICKRYKVMKDAIPDLLDFLHHTGIIYKNDDLIKDTIIIDQQWALDAIYKPLDRTSDFYKQLRNDFIGRVQVKYLFKAFGPEYREEHKWLFLNFMESCYLCFPLHKKQEYKENKTLEDYYIFPEFLPEEETPAVTNLWKTKDHIKTYTHEPNYLDYYRIQKFIVALGQKTKIEYIWKSGILVTTKKGMFQVSTDTQSTKLIIQIESTVIDDYLWSIIDIFKKHEDDQESLKWLQDDGSELSIQSLIKPENTLERKLHSQENTHHEIEKDRKQISLKELLPDQEQIPPKTLVISFASENIKDVKAVELSLKNYKANGRLQVLYDKKIMTGTRYWNPAIQEMFQKADGYLMLVSMEYQDFEERTYIWENEIPIIEKRLEEEGVFAYCMSVEPVAYNDRLDKFQAFKGGGTNCLPEKGHKRKRFLVEFAKEVIENQFLKEDEK